MLTFNPFLPPRVMLPAPSFPAAIPPPYTQQGQGHCQKDAYMDNDLGARRVWAGAGAEGEAVEMAHRMLMSMRRERQANLLVTARSFAEALPQSSILRNDLLTVAPDEDVAMEFQLIHDIERGFVPATACAFNLCIARAVRAHRLVDATLYLVRLHAHGLSPDVYTRQALNPLFEELERNACLSVQQLTESSRGSHAHPEITRAEKSHRAAGYMFEKNKDFKAMMGAADAGKNIASLFWHPEGYEMWSLSTRRVFFEAMMKQTSAESALAAYADLGARGGDVSPRDLLAVVQKWRFLRALEGPRTKARNRGGRKQYQPPAVLAAPQRQVPGASGPARGGPMTGVAQGAGFY